MKMKLIAVIFLTVVLSVQAEYSDKYKYYQDYNPYYRNARIIQYDHENSGNGRYRFAYTQTDGQAREEQGQIVNEGQPDEHLSVKGSYTWMDPEGVPYRVNYVADENGYQPEIEQGPGGGVPPAVVASLLG